MWYWPLWPPAPTPPPPRPGAAGRRSPSHGLALGLGRNVARVAEGAALAARRPADPAARVLDELDEPRERRGDRELAADPLDRRVRGETAPVEDPVRVLEQAPVGRRHAGAAQPRVNGTMPVRPPIVARAPISQWPVIPA